MKNEKPGRSKESRSGEADDRPSTAGSNRPGLAGNSNKRAVGENKGRDSDGQPQATPERSETPETPVTQTPVTEKPVALSPPKRTSEFVITVDNVTGLPTKIEKLDSKTGKRKELSKEEYLQVASYASSQPGLNYLGLGSYLGAPAIGNADLAQDYYRGVLDYLNALCSS